MTQEREAIDAAQDAIGALKRAMREIEKINTEAGRLAAANAAMGLRGELITWHAKATVAMREHFPEFADEVQAFGPGGGR